MMSDYEKEKNLWNAISSGKYTKYCAKCGKGLTIKTAYLANGYFWCKAHRPAGKWSDR